MNTQTDASAPVKSTDGGDSRLDRINLLIDRVDHKMTMLEDTVAQMRCNPVTEDVAKPESHYRCLLETLDRADSLLSNFEERLIQLNSYLEGDFS